MRRGAVRMIERMLPEAMPERVRAAHYLQPGLLHVAAEATTITTILGSCVAVCLWDGVRQLGGMNHFLLPRGVATPGQETRFGEPAMALLLDALTQAGARRGRLQAKVFGGGCASAPSQRADHLGLKNAAVALDWLAAAGIPVVAQDVGGVRGRKLLFHTDDGTALVKYL